MKFKTTQRTRTESCFIVNNIKINTFSKKKLNRIRNRSIKEEETVGKTIETLFVFRVFAENS